jgi:hypothetical protein
MTKQFIGAKQGPRRPSLSDLLHETIEESGDYGALVTEVTRGEPDLARPTMTNVRVDDHLLLRVLLAREPDALRSPGQRLFTTRLWKYRLRRALAGPSITGNLSRHLGVLPVL